jgi:hypothetical protein
LNTGMRRVRDSAPFEGGERRDRIVQALKLSDCLVEVQRAALRHSGNTRCVDRGGVIRRVQLVEHRADKRVVLVEVGRPILERRRDDVNSLRTFSLGGIRERGLVGRADRVGIGRQDLPILCNRVVVLLLLEQGEACLECRHLGIGQRRSVLRGWVQLGEMDRLRDLRAENDRQSQKERRHAHLRRA